MSSQDIIKSVSKKLQYYFQVKRLEDGFDLSGPYSPQLDHPPLKKRPTLLYDGLHDKPVKHYFSNPAIRQQITHMKGKPNTDRQDQIRKDVDLYLKNTHFVSGKGDKSKHPFLPEACYENTPRMGSRLKREMSGFGVPMKKSKRAFKGGYPLLRSRPPHNISKGEAHRLVNVATKLLCATEALDVDMPNKKEGMNRKITSAPQTRFRADKLPEVTNDEEQFAEVETYPPHRPVSANGPMGRRRGSRYTYDLHGRRVPIKQKMISAELPPKDSFDDTYLAQRRDDSAYVSNDNSADEHKQNGSSPRNVAPEQDQANIPHWLREQMQKVDSSEERKLHNNWVRPHGTPTPGVRSMKSDESPTPRSLAQGNSPRSVSQNNTPRSAAHSTKGPGSVKAPSVRGSKAPSSVGAASSIGPHPGYQARSGYGDGPLVCTPPMSVDHNRDVGTPSMSGAGTPGMNGAGTPGMNGVGTPSMNGVSADPSPRDYYVGDDVDLGTPRAMPEPRLDQPKNFNDFSDASDNETGGNEKRANVRPWSSKPPRSQTTRRKWIPRQDVDLSSGDEAGDQELMTDEDIPLVEDTGCQTGRELLLQYDHSETVVADGQEVTYKVIVRTGTRIGASTKADIFLILYGERGRSPELPLLTSKNHKVKFQKGQKDTFMVTFYHLGKLDKIKIGHHRTEIGSGWFLGSVTVRDPILRQSYEFPCDKWLSAREGEGITMRELKPVTQRNIASDGDSSTARSASPAASEEAKPGNKLDSPRSSTSMSSARSTTSTATSASMTPRSAPSTARSQGNESMNTSLQGNDSYRADKKKSSVTEDKSRESDTVTDTETDTDLSTSRSTSHRSVDEPEKKYEVEVKDNASEAESAKNEDDFFNSKPVEKDVSFLHNKGEREDKQSDEKSDDKSEFDSDKPQFSVKSDASESEAAPSDSETEGETAIIDNPEVPEKKKGILRATSDSENERGKSDSEQEQKPAVSDSEGDGKLSDSGSLKKDDYMSGFLAGLAAAKKAQAQQEIDSRTDQSEAEEDEELKIMRGPNVHEAAKSGNLERVKELCNHNSKLTNSFDEKLLTPLHISSTHGHVEVVRWLAANGADLELETQTGYTAMHLASLNGHVQCMMVLHAMGALLSLSIDQQSPLHLASMRGHLETVKWLVANRCDLEQEDSMGRTPADVADEYEHEEVFDFLKKCVDEQRNPDSSISMMRKNSHVPDASDGNDSSVVANKGSSRPLSASSTWSDDKKETEVKPARKISSVSEATDTETEADDTTLSESEDAATPAEIEKKKREEEEKEEKKKEFKQFEERRQSMGPGASFLDAIRAEYGDDI